MNSKIIVNSDLASFLETVDIELSGHCNARCIFCPRDKMIREKAILTEETFRRLLLGIAEIRPTGPRAFYLTGLGEPLLNRNIFDFAGSIRRHFPGTHIAVTSNGALLDLELCEAILGSEINSFQCSVPTIDEVSYEAVMGHKNFQSVIHWMTYLAEKKKAAGIEISVTMVRTTQTDSEVSSYRDFWEHRSVHVSERKVHNRGGFLEGAEPQETAIQRVGCGLFNSRLFVAGNGDLLACCHDLDGQSKLGTIGTDTLYSVLSSKKDMISRKKLFPMCFKCNDSCGQY
jgi:sulfatase maturation enzyme AslB (radical SAM superfamily)